MGPFETDWLGSRPVFYNERNGRISHTIHDVVDYANLEFDQEALLNYLDFGFSVFERTPIKHVRFLPPNSIATLTEGGRIKIEKKPDPAIAWHQKQTSEQDALDYFSHTVQGWERSTEGSIIVPTSGGYDSRLLNWAVTDRKRVRAFSYGVSKDQSHSYEVVYAQRIAKRLGIKWEWIPLTNFNSLIDEWEQAYGLSTHAHGMYQMEFYSRVHEKVAAPATVLSGIVGDVWAGSVPLRTFNSPMELTKLGYSHGIHADSTYAQKSAPRLYREEYWEHHRLQLQDYYWQVISTIRCKMILLSYLLRLPSLQGFSSWSPFVDPEVALRMLTIPADRRAGRTWQRDFFQKQGLDVESEGKAKVNPWNTLDIDQLRLRRPEPLGERLLAEVIDPGYVEWVNRNLILGWTALLPPRVWYLPVLRDRFKNPHLTAYNAYLVLLPIERAIRRREKARGAKP